MAAANESLLQAEQGSKNHEVVPTPLIAQIAGLRGGSGVHRSISALAKVGLIAKVKNSKYDGYRLTYGGLDYLALNTHRKTSTIYSLGNQIGVGKESDIYVVASETGKQLVLKIHRLGRISFRTVKANRDYLRNRTTGSWMYLSRLAAMKEFAFMKVLRREGFPVPEPVGQSRHTVVMEFIDAFPLRSIESVPNPALLYGELMDMIVRLATFGLIHGDFNEFNILIREDKINDREGMKLVPIIIDFPQMLSTTHQNAAFYFDRDVACIKRFFSRRFDFESDEPGPFFKDAIKESNKDKRLDVEVEATGFSRKLAKELDRYIEAVGQNEADEVSTEDDALAKILAENEASLDETPKDEDDDPDDLDDIQADDTRLEQDLGHLSLGAASTRGGYSFEPLDLPAEPSAVVEKVHDKKKAAGWAI